MVLRVLLDQLDLLDQWDHLVYLVLQGRLEIKVLPDNLEIPEDVETQD